MTAILLPAGRHRYHAYISGVYGPAVGYKLYTYEAGTTTPKATYSDYAGLSALPNPIILDADGECAPYGAGAYKFVLTDPDDVEVWTQDDIVISADVADSEWCGAATGTADAITLTPGAAVGAYASGQRFGFVCAAANTGAVTVAVDGLPAVALTKNGNEALEANDLQLGRIYQIQHDGTRFQLASDPRATLTVTAPAITDDSNRVVTSAWVKDLTATDARAGIQQNATSAEYSAGTATDRALTPAVARGGNLIRTASQTLTGATINFTSIPSWVKKITGSVIGASNAGGNTMWVRIGDSGGIETTSYVSSATSGTTPGGSTTAFVLASNSPSPALVTAHFTLTLSDTNEWVFSAIANGASGYVGSISVGYKTLSGTLDRLQLLNDAADTFDAGKASIIYE